MNYEALLKEELLAEENNFAGENSEMLDEDTESRKSVSWGEVTYVELPMIEEKPVEEEEMSLRVKIIEVTELDSKADRLINIVFRGVPHTTQVVKASKGNVVVFNEEFSWPLSSPIISDEYLELRMYNKSLFFSDKYVAGYKCVLSSLIDGEKIEFQDNLVDTYNRSIRSEIKLEICYTHPNTQDAHDIHIDLEEAEDYDEMNANGVVLTNEFLDIPLTIARRSAPSIITNKSGTNSSSGDIKSTAASQDDRAEITDCLEGKEAFHPKIRLPKSVSAKSSEWQVHVKIIEGKGLNGMAIDPFVEITVGDQKKHTTTKSHNNNPDWDEFFVFEFKETKEQLLDHMVDLQVMTGKSLVSQGNIIGKFKMDLWTVYGQPDHSYFSKWAVLLGPEPTEIKGYLRVDVSVFGKGEYIKVPPQRQEVDVEKNLLLPPDIHALRNVAKYCVRVYEAKGIPRMITNLMANVKKAITGKVKDLADPYVEVTFAGCKGKTKTVKSCYEPKFNQEIIFWELLPPMCRRMKIQLKDGDEAIGTHFIDLNEIFDMGSDGFMPCFGPCWVHLYGSTRDYSFFNENNELNNGIGEGISYRGRLLLEISANEYEACETGVVEVNDFTPKAAHTETLPKEKDFQLFGCFYEASMIDRRVGEKPVQFELSIGENGYHTEDSSQKDNKSLRSSKSEENLLLISNFDEADSDNASLTKPMIATNQSRRYCHMQWECNKPCLNLKFRMGDQRKRHYYQTILLKHHNRLSDHLDELDERMKLELCGTKLIMKRVLQELINGCTILIRAIQGNEEDKKSSFDLKNALDIERLETRRQAVSKISREAGEMLKTLGNDKEDMREKIGKMRHRFLKEMEELLIEPHHGFPDIFIWMLSGGKRVAYSRIPASDVLYSDNDHERGMFCGSMQTLFMKLAGKRALSERGWAIQAKVNLIIWLGLDSEKKHMLNFVPKGFEQESECKGPYPAIPRTITYTEKNQFILRAHIYQARSLFASDDTGLSDALARVIYCNKVKETRVILQTRSPTWDQMMKFKNITLWGNAEEFCCNPPMVVIELYDKDPNGDTEFIGRSLAMPVVKLAGQPYDAPFFPPNLQWFPICRGEEKAGDLLAAFELLQVTGDELADHLPYDPEPTANGIVPIPLKIRPDTKKYRIEVFFWGVREMKRAKYLQVTRPRVDLDCCYKIQQIDLKTGKYHDKLQQYITSTICKNARINPNFDDPVVVFDVDLPEKERYTPPITIRVTDCRAFGRHVIAGSYVINSLQKYVQEKESYQKYVETENMYLKRFQSVAEINGALATQMSTASVATEVPALADPKAKMKMKVKKQREEVIDWWTRLHVTLRDSTDSEAKTDCEAGGKTKDDASVARIKVYPYELEKENKFDGFNDSVETFPLSKGKQSGNEDEEDCKRFSGKFKGCIRVWKFENLPTVYQEPKEFKTTFKDHKLPKYEPVKVLVRVYCIRACNLKPADPNGKADPYLIVTLGKHKINDKKNLITRQLNPEFGRSILSEHIVETKCSKNPIWHETFHAMFEFEAELPFDNLLTIQIKDWDLMSMDDFIGETKIDVENRFYSKHRPRCGLPLTYSPHGYAKWRDSMKPRQILSSICKQEGLPKPCYKDGVCDIGGKKFFAEKDIKDERGNPIPSDEPAALKALRNFHELDKGFHLVPEHIETRYLYRPDKPGIKQGSLDMWVDMFPMEGPSPGPAVDIAPRKPEEFQLRVIVWNTDDIPPADTNILTGIPSSDIYVKGWLEGYMDDLQKTDVHYRSTDGNGMFNWRFIFTFLFHRAEEKFITKKKASIFGLDEWEEKHCPLLHLEVLDADVFSSDDMIGDLVLNLTRIPPPMKAPKLCDLDKLKDVDNLTSLVQSGAMRGWWPIKGYDDHSEIVQKGEVEIEFELLRKEEAEANPAGRGRDEPQPLAKPNRPADSLNMFMSPLRMIQLLLCSHKTCLIKCFVILLLMILMGLFFYSMPGYTVKKIFNA